MSAHADGEFQSTGPEILLMPRKAVGTDGYGNCDRGTAASPVDDSASKLSEELGVTDARDHIAVDVRAAS
jgi:hypothetical protein